MKSIYFILLFIGFSATAPAQGVKSFKDATNKYGLKDSKGNVIVSPKYNFINEFKTVWQGLVLEAATIIGCMDL